MKTHIKTLLDSVVSENKEFIKKNDQTVAEYLLENSEEQDRGWLFYLSDEEIEQFENDEAKAANHIREIGHFVNQNYNYKLD